MRREFFCSLAFVRSHIAICVPLCTSHFFSLLSPIRTKGIYFILLKSRSSLPGIYSTPVSVDSPLTRSMSLLPVGRKFFNNHILRYNLVVVFYCQMIFVIPVIEFNFSKMVVEPLILVTAFFLLFLVSIIYVRMDFSITVDEGAQEQLHSSSMLLEMPFSPFPSIFFNNEQELGWSGSPLIDDKQNSRDLKEEYQNLFLHLFISNNNIGRFQTLLSIY